MKQKNLILMVVAVGCGLVAAFLTTQINAKPKVEKISVWVAKKDLPVGTILTKTEILKLAERKEMPKDALPPAFVTDEAELLDKRLTRSVLKDETFNPGALTKGGVVTLPDGFDLVTLPLNAGSAVAGFVTPGCKVDVLATMRLGNKLKAFPLLVDMLILAVDNNVDNVKAKEGTYPNLNSVSFAATQEQALLLALAKQRGCHLELTLRHPNKAVDKEYDIKKVIAMIQDEKNPADLKKTENARDPNDIGSESPVLPLAPAPEPKEELVKVWVATTKIPAGTEITKELMASKLKEAEMPRKYAVGAHSDLTECINQNLTLKTDLDKDAWISSSLVGPPQKASPQDPFNLPKGGLVTEPPKVTQRKFHDTTIHTPNGAVIHRFEEVSPGVWKLSAILTPEEAGAKRLKDPTPPAPAPMP